MARREISTRDARRTALLEEGVAIGADLDPSMEGIPGDGSDEAFSRRRTMDLAHGGDATIVRRHVLTSELRMSCCSPCASSRTSFNVNDDTRRVLVDEDVLDVSDQFGVLLRPRKRREEATESAGSAG